MSRVADPMATLALRVVAFHGSARAALLALVGVLVETKDWTALTATSTTGVSNLFEADSYFMGHIKRNQ